MILFLALGCTNSAQDDYRVSLLQSIGNDILITTLDDFRSRSEALHQQTQDDCSTQSLVTLRQRWWEAREPWKQMEMLKFGPYKEEPLRLGPNIDFWPVRPDTVDEI